MDEQQKKVAKEFDEYHRSYSDKVNDSVSFTGLDVDYFTAVKAAYILDNVNEILGSQEQISCLDIGCGVGNFHRLLFSKIGSLTGIDVSEQCINTARMNNPGVDYDVYDGVKLPYQDNSFDLVFAVCVLHHVPTHAWSSFVCEMSRVLKSGGVAMIFEHNPLNPLTKYVVNNCPFDENAVLLRGSKTVSLFQEAGFKMIDLRYVLSVPAKTSFSRRIDRLFSKLPFGAQYYVSSVKP